MLPSYEVSYGLSGKSYGQWPGDYVKRVQGREMHQENTSTIVTDLMTWCLDDEKLLQKIAT